MAAEAIAAVCRAYPALTPENVWHKKSRSQLLMLLRTSRAQDGARLGQTAAIMRAAVSAAIANGFGQETPSFDEMVRRMMGATDADPSEGAIANAQALEASDISRGPSRAAVDDMQEF